MGAGKQDGEIGCRRQQVIPRPHGFSGRIEHGRLQHDQRSVRGGTRRQAAHESGTLRRRHFVQDVGRHDQVERSRPFQRFLASAPQGYELAPGPVAGPDATSWLRDVVLRSPRLIPAAVVYVSVVLLAERRRRSASWDVRSGWGRVTIPAPRQASPAEQRTDVREG